MVPNSWSERRLEEVASLRRGISWSKDEEVEPPEGEPVLSIPNIQPDGLDLSVLRHIQINSERAAKYRAEPGWLIMVGSNGNPDRIGDCVPVPADRSLLFASFLLGLKPEDSVVTPSFLRWAVQGPILQRQIRGEVQGSTGLQNLSLRTISSYRIPVPPLPEQRKIGAVLSSVDDAIAATRKVVEQTRRVKQGLLQTLMSRGIGHTRFKKTEIGEIPENWEVVKLEDVASRGSGHTPSKRFPEYWDGDINWVSLSDSDALDEVYLTETKKTITSEGIANSSAVLHPAGTVFVSRDASVGRSAIAACDLAVSQHFIAWQCGDRLNNHFLYYFLQHHKPQFDRIAVGSTIKTIGLGYFKRLQIPLPPRAEQDRLAEALLGHDRAVWAQEATIEELSVLKRGLMQDLLTGRVRVKPD